MRNAFGLNSRWFYAVVLVGSCVLRAVASDLPGSMTVSMTLDWVSDTDCRVVIHVTGTRTGDAAQQILVTMETPTGGVVAAVINKAWSDSGGTIDETAYFDVPDGRAACRARLEYWENGTGGEPSGQQVCKIPDRCIRSPEQLQPLLVCGACDSTPKQLGEGSVRVFKKERSVYALAGDYEGEATFGEIVSGRFRAPSCGVLKFKATGVNENVRVFRGGWNGEGQTAENATEYQTAMQPGEAYQFAIKAIRGAQNDVVITFDWYVWLNEHPAGSSNEHCVEHYQYQEGGAAGLRFSVPVLPAYLKPVAPGSLVVLSGYKYEETNPTGVWYELEKPMCGPNGENVTRSFVIRFTDGFIFDPTSAGIIPDGHGIGWRKVDNKLVAPDPDGLEYFIEGL